MSIITNLVVCIYQWPTLGKQVFTHLKKSVFSSKSCPLNMYLDVGNQFGIISPTHDFKLVTRLQHASQAVRAMSSAAEKNRMAETFPGQRRRRTLISSVYRFADCIENGHMPGDLHAVMSTAPSRFLNCYHPGSSKWRGKCQRKCWSRRPSDQQHNGPGRSI